MTTALIGYTGFVGGNLLRQSRFDDLYHSKNISDIRGREYDTIVCAGARAEKWKANADPSTDRSAINHLIGNISQASAKKFVLISTVDVYPLPSGVDEDSPIDPTTATAYGRHRYELELELAERFDTTIIRLPGLFGPGIKKNIIFDLLNDNQVDKINPASVFQYYNLSRLSSDIRTALGRRLKLVNFATEPIETSYMAQEVFGKVLRSRPGLPARYDLRSCHAELFGGADGYLQGRDQVLKELKSFVYACASRLVPA